MFNLCWGEKVSEEFRKKLITICSGFSWTNDHANWLMACIAFETGETFSPSIKNAAGSGATGLIQFMPSTAKGLGTTTEELAKMRAEDQLSFVRLYFLPYFRRIHDINDMYMAILLPSAIGKPDAAALFVAPTIAYRQNKGLDTDGDGVVTKAEASAKIREKFIRGYQFSALVEDVKVS